MRTLLRAILSVALLLGSGVTDWAPASAQVGGQAHESCCCGASPGAEDSCPCPKPEGNRNPSPTSCPNRVVAVAVPAARRTLAERRTEPRPEPATWAETFSVRKAPEPSSQERGRDPDLGRHLARLETFRI